MCGRSAQSVRGVETAEEILTGAGRAAAGSAAAAATAATSASHSLGSSSAAERSNASPSKWGTAYNNVNMGPGMEGLVIRKVDDQSQKNIECIEMRWGLIPKAGTKTSPLPTGPSLTSLHYSNLMYNARSDTLYDKRTFRDLALKGKTCIVAVDGFYEWKESETSAIGGGSGKQPYYVHRSDGKPLLIAGLWTSVPTGREVGYDGKPEVLTSYTLLTTDACPKLQWLHHRQPVFLWDVESANEWLHKPTQTLEKRIAKESSTDHDALVWYPVTKRMNKTQYREHDCNVAIKIEKVPSVKSFFTKGFVAKSSQGKTAALTETGPKDYLEEGWKEKATSQMESSKRQSPSSPSKASSPTSKKTKLFPPASPSAIRLGNTKEHKLVTGKPSPARKGQITSFFSASKKQKS